MRYLIWTLCGCAWLLAASHSLAETSSVDPSVTPAKVEPGSGHGTDYPPLAIRRREQGSVTLTLTIDDSGFVSDTSVAQSSGSEQLDVAAQYAALNWHYQPAMRKHVPIQSQKQIKLDFSLTGMDVNAYPAIPPLPPGEQIPVVSRQLKDEGVIMPSRDPAFPMVPFYPPLARRLDLEGQVVLELTVGTDGLVDDVVLVKSSGHKLLDFGSELIAAQGHYKPAMRDGQPIVVRLPSVLTYQLK